MSVNHSKKVVKCNNKTNDEMTYIPLFSFFVVIVADEMKTGNFKPVVSVNKQKERRYEGFLLFD